MIVLLAVDDMLEPNKQDAEIAQVEWLDINDALEGDDVHEHNKNFIREGIKRLYVFNRISKFLIYSKPCPNPISALYKPVI